MVERITFNIAVPLDRYLAWQDFQASGIEAIAAGMDVRLAPVELGDTERARTPPERFDAEMVFCGPCGLILVDGEACAHLSFGAGEVPSGHVRYLGEEYGIVYWRSNHGMPV